MWKIRFLLFLLLAISPHQGLFSQSAVERELKKIGHSDRVCLAYFFRDFFLHESLGHVLFFETKPACMHAFSVHPHQHFMGKKIADGWNCWKKYEASFPHPDYLFIEEDSPFYPRDKLVFFLNKKTLFRCLHENHATFIEILGNSFTPEGFIQELESKQSLYALIKEDSCLLGIILGFGYESSNAFKKHELEQTVQHNCTYGAARAKIPKNCRFWPVSFMGNPNSSEVKSLLHRYEQEILQLDALYRKSNDLLKNILDKLCE